jgi:uncharacterized membrane protein YbaN (DUF454 family)
VGNEVQQVAPVRWAFCGLGLLFVALGVIGTILPVMPGFVFFIMALWAFRHGSPMLEAKLLGNRVIGPRLQDWDTHHRIPLKIKWIACSCIILFGGSSTWRMMGKTIAIPPSDPRYQFSAWWVQLPLLLLMAYGVWFIVTKPSE